MFFSSFWRNMLSQFAIAFSDIFLCLHIHRAPLKAFWCNDFTVKFCYTELPLTCFTYTSPVLKSLTRRKLPYMHWKNISVIHSLVRCFMLTVLFDSCNRAFNAQVIVLLVHAIELSLQFGCCHQTFFYNPISYKCSSLWIEAQTRESIELTRAASYGRFETPHGSYDRFFQFSCL